VKARQIYVDPKKTNDYARLVRGLDVVLIVTDAELGRHSHES
jgi:hypothetical protein